MSQQNSDSSGRGLSRGQRQVLLWMPLIGIWLVLVMISRMPEGGRDWSSMIGLGLLSSAAYVGVWFGLVKLTRPKETRTEEKQSATRAELVYGKKGDTECDDDAQ